MSYNVRTNLHEIAYEEEEEYFLTYLRIYQMGISLFIVNDCYFAYTFYFRTFYILFSYNYTMCENLHAETQYN